MIRVCWDVELPTRGGHLDPLPQITSVGDIVSGLEEEAFVIV